MTGYFVGSDKQVRDCETGKLCAERAAEIMREALEDIDGDGCLCTEWRSLRRTEDEPLCPPCRAAHALALIDSVEVNTA